MDESTNIIGYQRLAESILMHTLSTAYLTVAKTPIYTNTKIQQEAFTDLMFIIHNGLGIIIKDFGLGYDGENLKILFLNFLKRSYKEIKSGGEVPAGYSNQKLDKIISIIETSEILDR